MVPGYKTLNKYDHVLQACINPSPTKRKPLPTFHPKYVELESSPLKLEHRVREKKELSPRLLRIPYDPNAAPSKPKVFLDTKGMNNRQKKAAKEAADKAV